MPQANLLKTGSELAIELTIIFFFSLAMALLFVGCAGVPGLPAKPQGDLCTLVVTDPLASTFAVCAPISQINQTEDLYYARFKPKLGQSPNRPLSSLNKAVVFDPVTWNQIADYIQRLKAIALHNYNK